MEKRNTIFSQGGQFRVGEELFYFALGGTYPVTDYVMSMCLRRIPNSFYIQICTYYRYNNDDDELHLFDLVRQVRHEH